MINNIIKYFRCDQCCNYKSESKAHLNDEFPDQVYYYHICKLNSKEIIYNIPACINFIPIDNVKNTFDIKCLEFRIEKLENAINKNI